MAVRVAGVVLVFGLLIIPATIAEPTVDDATLAEHPKECDSRIIAFFLIVRCRKPG